MLYSFHIIGLAFEHKNNLSNATFAEACWTLHCPWRLNPHGFQLHGYHFSSTGLSMSPKIVSIELCLSMMKLCQAHPRLPPLFGCSELFLYGGFCLIDVVYCGLMFGRFSRMSFTFIYIACLLPWPARKHTHTHTCVATSLSSILITYCLRASKPPFSPGTAWNILHTYCRGFTLTA